MSKFTVAVTYRNKNLEPVKEHVYDLKQYTEIIKLELMRTLGDVERAFYKFENNKDKEDWNDENYELFQRIRHRLLDQANSIERLPANIRSDGREPTAVPMSDIIANMFSNATVK